MSEPFVFQRRDFLKLVGLGVAGGAAGCAQPPAASMMLSIEPIGSGSLVKFGGRSGKFFN